jgi:ferrous iron transport protein B
VLADASNLKRNLLFVSQILDLKIPTIIALNMLDVAQKNGISVQVKKLSEELGVKIIPINARNGEGLVELKKQILQPQSVSKNYFIEAKSLQSAVVAEMKQAHNIESDYAALLTAHHFMNIFCLDAKAKEQTKNILQQQNFNSTALQGEETLLRYDKINAIVRDCVKTPGTASLWHPARFDKFATHPIYGYLFFLLVMFVMFQLIFSIAQVPMDWIDLGVRNFTSYLTQTLPNNGFTDLITNGIIAGLGGIVVFIPQIMLLFAFITILEDSGYMARVSFMMDKLMRKVGMNGRSVVPLISGMACAVPAIMSARTIDNKRDRLITILVTPLMSCSARLPVYVLLVSLIVPHKVYFGVFSIQAFAMMGLYLLGFFSAIIVGMILRFFIKAKERSFFIMELPIYRMPRWGNVFSTMIEKAKIFVWQAGKVILAISVSLWFLASFGPMNKMVELKKNHDTEIQNHPENKKELESEYAMKKLECSYAGHLGKLIEPVIRPLGYDWKIGISLITSFAAREVFVGTMSTLYSVGTDNRDSKTLLEKMKMAKRDDNNEPVFSIATVFSLLLFYAFAMQCMSTVAVVKRETGSWKWAAFQIAYMTVIAYGSSFTVYQLLK